MTSIALLNQNTATFSTFPPKCPSAVLLFNTPGVETLAELQLPPPSQNGMGAVVQYLWRCRVGEGWLLQKEKVQERRKVRTNSQRKRHLPKAPHWDWVEIRVPLNPRPDRSPSAAALIPRAAFPPTIKRSGLSRGRTHHPTSPDSGWEKRAEKLTARLAYELRSAQQEFAARR